MSQKKEKPVATIRRLKHERKFVVVGNELAQREDISYEAIGMLVSLLSRPDDWEVILTALQREGCKRDKVARIVNELLHLGYIAREELPRVEGKFVGTQYSVSELPQPHTDKPYTDKPHTAEPDTVDQPLQRTYLESFNKEQIVEKPTTTKPPSLSFSILGSSYEKYVRLYTLERVEEVCLHASKKAKKTQSGWAVSALDGKWDLGDDIVDGVVDSVDARDHDEMENTRTYWRVVLRRCFSLLNISSDEAYDLSCEYMHKFPDDIYLFESGDDPYENASAQELLEQLYGIVN